MADDDATDVNGEIAEKAWLEDDGSLLSNEYQEFSRSLNNCTHEQLRTIAEGKSSPVVCEDSNIPEDEYDDEEEEQEEDVDEDEEKRGLQEIYLEAKSMVDFTDYIKKKRKAKGDGNSNVWKVMKVAHIRDGLAEELRKKDQDAHHKLTLAAQEGQYYFCCLICFNSADVSLTKCLIKPTLLSLEDMLMAQAI